tara:strand:- start:65 stop:370 length:306 start_codon:yes stop_codon:yes gene_type:complete
LFNKDNNRSIYWASELYFKISLKNSIFLYIFVQIHFNMLSFNLFLAIGPWQVVLVAVVILLLFGGKKIPELMKGLGSGIKEFKKGVKEEEESSDDSSDKES